MESTPVLKHHAGNELPREMNVFDNTLTKRRLKPTSGNEASAVAPLR
jgi:hypothetical protein